MARNRQDKERPVLPWRLIVGICLHFAIPAYLIFLLAAFLLAPAPPTDAEQGVRWLLRESGRFILLFALLMVAAGVGAALLDPPLRALRRRRHQHDPDLAATASRERAQAALARIDAPDWGAAGARVAAAGHALGRASWDHHDPAGQRLSQDLKEAADAFVPALQSARAAKRAELADLAAQAIERIAAALDELAADKSRLDEGDARTIARLIDLRYGANRHPVSLDRPKDQE